MRHFPILEFVSYNGGYPNLCAGELVLRLEKTHFTFESHALASGGSVSFDDDWSEIVTDGPWVYQADELPEGFPPELRWEIEFLANQHIPHGCCGGCV
jgi:hypothetical protein